MVFKRTSMKRKRKVGCSSQLLDDSPKRTKIHAQRKFAQGSNVNSPVITPIKELESDIPTIDVLPEPVELLPIKRPNTEDFLTFLCFRGTPILPPSLNFFNTASIVDTNGQVHEIKSESPKNGPIDIAKCGSSSEKPFIAFGVRKRADPIVISRQMDRKRRHALALQALRRKYQEQKMAKIRALTISKLSEKVTNKTLVRTNTVSKTETVTKKTNTLQKTKVIATKHVKVTTETLKTTLRPKIKPKMCLRSFRGRFVQKELPFRKRMVPDKKIIKKPMLKKEGPKKKKVDVTNDNASDDEPLSIPVKEAKPKATTTKVIKKTISASETSSPRITRSGISNAKIQVRRQQIKKRILLSTPSTTVKPRSLRSTTMKKTVLSQRKSKSLKAKQKLKAQQRVHKVVDNKTSKLGRNLEHKKAEIRKSMMDVKPGIKPPASKKEPVKTTDLKKEVNKPGESKRDANKTVEIKKEVNKLTDIKKSTDIKKCVDIKKESNKVSEKDKKQITKTVDVKKEVTKSVDVNKEISKGVEIKKEISKPVDVKKEGSKLADIKKQMNKDDIKKVSKSAIKKEVNSRNISREVTKLTEIKKEVKNIEVIVDKSKSSDKKKDLNICIEKNKKEIVKSTESVKKVNSKIVENKNMSASLSSDKVSKKDEDIKAEDTLILEKSKNTKSDNINPNNLTKASSIKKDAPEVATKKETVTKKDEQIKKDEKDKSIKVVVKKDIPIKEDITDISIKLDVHKIGINKSKKDPPKKEAVIVKKEDITKKKDSEKLEEHSLPKMTPRPSRKTKEAAAIYMEILSHKLVNDSKIDDDNISIDSFPELPNVKKTEQRENELKAQAKSTKDDCKEKIKTDSSECEESDTLHGKNIQATKSLEECKTGKQKSKKTNNEDTMTENISNKEKTKTSENVEHSKQDISDDTNLLKQIKTQPETKSAVTRIGGKLAQKKPLPVDTKKVPLGKRKCVNEADLVQDIDSVDDSKKAKVLKSENAKSVNNPLESKINKPLEFKVNHPLESKVNKPLESKVNKPLETKVNKPLESKINKPLESKVNKPLESKASKPLETKVNKPLESKINKSLESKVNKPLESKASKPLETKVNKPLESKINKPLESKVNKPLESKASKPLETKVNKPLESKVNKPSESKVNKPLESKKDVAVDTLSDKDVLKRQTRHSSQAHKKEDTDDSDESFHIDIKVPRKKKLTRSKTPKVLKNDSNIEKVNNGPKVVNTKNALKPKEDLSSSDSDHSTTSDINLQTLMNKAKNKKFSKTKSMKKTEVDFSDSDEEPLSKLTNRSIEGSQKSTIPYDKVKEKPKQDMKVKEIVKSTAKNKSTIKPALKTPEVDREIEDAKPKRECAKRPQNYLPMLSSSDEDDIFHGFDGKTEDKISTSVPAVEPNCTHVPPLLDLLNKDIGRRFGKEKVNMSNEQIEKWLKDSALAGSSIKKENDEMLKFGERIPTETTLETVEIIDTQKLKCSLLEPCEEKKQSKEAISVESPSAPVKKFEKIELPLNSQIKPQTLDRKLIFRKSKKDTAPNINAFSPENESSVYAFGEENEETISTPFRRPSRRPSSTATSRSEDESSKHDDSLKTGHFRKPTLKQDVLKFNKEESDINIDTDESSHHFYIPQKPTKHNFSGKFLSGSVNKLKLENKTILKLGKSSDRFSESEDFKYKIPSSPSASSSSSAKLYKRQTQKQKVRPPEFISPVYVSDFPKKTDPAKLVEAPVFHPTDQEFQDPLEYIERIRHKAEQFGICRIVPPSSFKPECKVTDDMRFTAYNQYVHKMLHRWGPNFKELMAIKKYLETQNISLTHPPWIGGMEIDLPRLYQTVQTLGGLKEVIEKKKWPRVSELMKIPKSAQDRVTKLDDIYCKYLLPYDTLSPAEREKLFDEVETEWAKRESKTLLKAQQKLVSGVASEVDSEPDDNEVEECITKGRNMALNAFYRIARNTMSMYFKTTEPAPQEVEQEYWKHVTMRQNHICVHSGSIDSGNWGYGFAVSKNSPFARHAWNLKVLTNNSGSVLRSLGPIMGVTVPTLHVGMVFSACCWYRDPHGLPWIEYLHTGGSKIWYGIPNSTSDLFHYTLKKLVPNYCKNKELCLPSDTVMVPPSLLVENNLSLCRTVQDPGQFIVVFPKAFTSSISTGYVVSESVYFAPPYWLKTARSLFDALRNSREPSMFSLDRLILSIASDGRCNPEILRQIIPHVQELCDKEKERRVKLKTFGTMERERMPLPEANNRKKKKLQGEEGDYECEICRMNLFVSMVFDTQETVTYCLDHAIEMIENNKSNVSNCKFMFTYDDEELDGLPTKLKMCIENKQQKKVPNKYAGMPTLLTK